MLFRVRPANSLLLIFPVFLAVFVGSLASYGADDAPRMPILPDSAKTGGLMSWGGNDSTRWQPEAKFANAASLALNRAWQDPNVSDAIVAIPLMMASDDLLRPSGDGQTNAHVEFGSWTEPHPPLVAVLLRMKDGTSKASFFFDASLSVSANQMQISYLIRGQRRTPTLDLETQDGGGKTATWNVDADLDWALSTQEDVAFVHPLGWENWFPIYFRHPVAASNDLLQGLRPQDRTLIGGRSAIDPEKVSALIPGNSPDVNGTLTAHIGHFGAGFNQEPFPSDNVHGEYQFFKGGPLIPTGVGQSSTWVIQPPTSSIKSMYMCFDKRNESLESKSGVPSGAGPIKVGIDPDPSHPGNYSGTIMNVLETSPFVLVSAVKSPSASVPPTGTYAYGLTDIATVRWLRTGEASPVTVGQSDWGYAQGKPTSVTTNYHWFFFNQDSEFCTQAWISPCMPHQKNNDIGFNPTNGCDKPLR